MDSDVEKIKERLPINEVVGQYVQLKRAGKNFSAKCPFHKERTPSFNVSPERGTYMCFGCGEKGDIFSFVQKVEGLDFPQALRQLAAKAGVELHGRFTKGEENKHKEKNARVLEALEEASTFFERALFSRSEVMQYLHARGLTDETIQTWRLGYAAAEWRELCEHLLAKGFSKEEVKEAGLAIESEKRKGEVYDRFRGRVMFPLFSPQGEVIAFSGRFFEKTKGSTQEGEPAKYVNSPETLVFKKGKTLYGFDKAKSAIRKLDCILLVEGQMDLLVAHQAGLPFTVALSGTALTEEHLGMLSRLSKRLVLALDADQAGLKAGLKSALMALQRGFDIKIPTLPQGKDPADLGRENAELLKAAVRTSQTAVEYFLNALWPTARDERSYKRLVEAQVLPLIAAMQSRIEQAHFIGLVAGRLGVPEGAVRQEVEKLLRSPHAREAESDEAPKPIHDELTALERTAGMLVYSFEQDEAMQTRLVELLAVERLAALKERLAPHAEALRFRFEAEVGEIGQEAIAGDLLRQLEVLLIDEEIAGCRGDMKRITALARRKHDLLK